MASDSITLWQIEGEKVEAVTNFNYLGSKITVGNDSAMKLKKMFFGRKTMTNLDGVLKNRDITLPTRVHRIKAMIFPVVRCGCESWIIKKVEHQRIDAFKLWC